MTETTLNINIYRPADHVSDPDGEELIKVNINQPVGEL